MSEKTMKLEIIKLVSFLILLFVVGSTSADAKEERCTADFYEAVGHHIKHSGLASRNQNGNVVSESCKSWPYNNDLALSAFAYDEGIEYEKKLVVAVIDKKTKRVVSSYQNVIGEDAITEVGENSLQLDTARYQIAKGVRAFGLRFNNSARGASCGEAHWNNELTLLMPEGRKLRPVLSLNMYQERSIQGCLSTQVPDAIWENASLTIEVGKTSTNGFYDLAITANITVSSNGAPIENAKDRVEHHILRYNGKHYEKGKGIPWWLAI